MLIMIENIYITIGNVNVSGKKSCLEDIPNTLIVIKIFQTMKD